MAGAALISCLILAGDTPAVAAPAPASADPLHARLLFAGDLMQHLPQVNAARREGGFDYGESFAAVTPLFREADLAVVNLETTLSPSGPYSGYPCFRSPTALAGALAATGVDVAVLANNHCCDGGRAGIGWTIEALDAAGIRHTGAFADSTDYRLNNVLYLHSGGIRFALVNYTYGTNGIPVPQGRIVHPLDSLHMACDLASIGRDTIDCVIAFIHWGDEYARLPNRSQRELAAFLRRQGVDLIVGSHPHVIQPFEGDESGFTLYSLGNFVSNQRKRYCDGGLLACIDVTLLPGGVKEYVLDLIPVWVQGPSYRILTPAAVDTVRLGATERIRYREFCDDTRELLFGRESFSGR